MADPPIPHNYPQPMAVDADAAAQGDVNESSSHPSSVMDSFGSGGPEDIEMKAIMATLTNAQSASPSALASKGSPHDVFKPVKAETSVAPKPQVQKMPMQMSVENRSSNAAGKGGGQKSTSQLGVTNIKQAPIAKNGEVKEGPSSPKLKRAPSSMASENAATTSEDDDIPVAVPVEDDTAETSAVTATIVEVGSDAKPAADKVPSSSAVSKDKDSVVTGKDAADKDSTISDKDSKKLKRLNSDISITTSSTSKKGKKRARRSSSMGPSSGKNQGSQGFYRSAAAAHRNRQIHVPPIGSPGLLMLPTPANTAVFPSVGSEEEARERWLVKVGEDGIVTGIGAKKGKDGSGKESKNTGKEAKGKDGKGGQEYLLPSTVFRQSMIMGGYTIERRRERPHRGSSTERTVGDMFDSDAGGLYLHFPELIPPPIWEKRLGDKSKRYREEPPPRESPNRLSKGGCDSKKDKEGRPGPKGARSSYIFFTNAQRPIFAAQNPGMRFTEQGVIMGERWRALTPEEKKPYEEMANRDKERYTREMKQYIDSVKKEIKHEKQGGSGGVKKDDGKDESGKDESKEGESKAEESKDGDESAKKVDAEKNFEEIKGPRLVDAMILSLSKMLGEKVNRREVPQPESVSASQVVQPEVETTSSVEKPEPISTSQDQPEVDTTASVSKPEPVSSPQINPEADMASEAKPEPVSSSNVTTNNPPPQQPEAVPSSDATNVEADPPPRPRHVSPDLTLDELPQFIPPSTQPQTLPRSHRHAPMSFLDMIPISLTSAYPPSYVAKRKAYAKAVLAREEAIVDAQEAKDDAEDAQEKYLAHTEAWERMLEYQKGMYAKREAERKKQREKEEAEQKEKEEREAAEKKEKELGENGEGGKSEDATSAEAGSSAVEKPKDDISKDDTAAKDAAPSENGSSSNTEGASGTADDKKDEKKEEEKKARPPSPPPEDPMDCMPPRPQPPGPARVVSIPDIPVPPTPPPVVEVGPSDHNWGTFETESKNNGKDASKCKNETTDATVPMRVPKVNKRLLQHLDPSCFLPTMSGRYLGLLSNHISDPQFCGVLAPGIAGNTFGGGAGLATSYAGGGRGAAGLVSGPTRGGNLWGTPAHVGRSKSDGEKSEKKTPVKEKSEKIEVKPDEVTSSKSSATASDHALAAKISKEMSKDESNDKVSSSPKPDPAPSTPAAVSSASKKRPAATSSSPNKTTITTSSTTMTITTPSESASAKKKKKQKRATAFGLATGDRNTSATEIASGHAGPDFPDGWIVKTYRRSGGETIGKTDRFWFSPGRNIRFRAKKHAKAFVEILGEPKVDGDEDKAAEIYRARGLHF